MSYILHPGDQGQEVSRLQAAIGMQTATGIYDPATVAAVRALQQAQGLGVDGVAGPKTLGSLGIAPLPGIDVSHFQGTIDWTSVAAAGIRFAFIKASEGRTGTDDRFVTNWACSKVAGIPRGAYHFAHPAANSPEDEADNFLRVLNAVDAADLPAVLDLEAAAISPPAALQDWAARWLRRVQAAANKTPILYTGSAFLRASLARGGALAPTFPLWIARYNGGVDPGDVGAWPEWRLWQWSANGAVPGIAHDVDLDWLVGGEAALTALTT